jgi:hypothetical protein
VQRNLAAAMIGDLEVRSLVANIQHASSSERIQYEPQLSCQRHAAIVVVYTSTLMMGTNDPANQGGGQPPGPLAMTMG